MSKQSTARLTALRNVLAKDNVPALLVTSGPNRRYLTGFTGSSGWVLILPEQAVFMTDGRYAEQARGQVAGYDVEICGADGLTALLNELLPKYGVTALQVEGESLSYLEVSRLSEAVDPVRLTAAESPVPALRLLKDEAEVAVLRQAEAIGDAAFSHILGFIRPGLTEVDVALELEGFMRRQGASDRSFETIVASGPRSALPHGVATDRVLQTGDLITLDFGCVFQGYCSDMTRTVALGSVEPKLREIYEVVLAAQQAALAALRPGLSGPDADKVARDIITEAGYGEYFTHGTGHGVGLEIHEAPRLSTAGKHTLATGMIVTVEPGIYLPGLGGVRIEDMAVITDTGYEVLSHSPKEWIEL